MVYSNDDSSDMEKLQKAFVEISSAFGSVDNLLEAFGLSDMPQAQRYGIMFGCLVFVCTVTAVLALLVLGGSFRRIAEQEQTGEASLQSSHEMRNKRSLLLEQLLEGRERLLRNYPTPETTEGITPLTRTLMNVAPAAKKPSYEVEDFDSPGLMEEKDNKQDNPNVDKKQETGSKVPRYVPPHYEENYTIAYRKCQDKPGGAILSGRPEARFEAYARGFAGCGPYTSLAYRRSYARMYESICCQNHATDDRYAKLFSERPQDIIGRYMRLEPLDVDRHLQVLFDVTSGDAYNENNAYDPQEVWSFREDGPFEDAKAMRKSFVFMHLRNEAAFGIVNAVTERVIGAIQLTHDDPQNLSVQMELPIVPPHKDGSSSQMEACFLLMDRLFALGYRRIQVAMDSQDVAGRKLATRLGCTMEGVLYRHMIMKEASRDSLIYGMLNSDWKKGARSSLFKKLYGVKAQRVDAANEKQEEELDEQQRVLREKAEKEKLQGKGDTAQTTPKDKSV